MSEMNWYSPQASQVREPEKGTKAKRPRKKRGFKSWHVGAILGLLVVAIAVSSLAFAGTGGSGGADRHQRGDSERMPEDWKKFFESYYERVTTQAAHIDIPPYEGRLDFSLELKESSGEELSLKELYERCADSIVAITGYQDGKAGYYWGTGVIITADGLVLTNTHVIDNCDRATVTLSDDRELEAKLVGADAISDIALLKIEATGLKAAGFGESGKLSVGEHVAAIGNPLGQTFRSTLTDGIISAIERGISYNGHSMTLLQTNTALNEGNSGGALFNMYGQVVGVTNMKMMSAYSSIEGIAFAIPSATVRQVVNSLLRYGEVRGRPAIGITVGAIPANALEHYELPEGLYVSEVNEGSDAQKKGVKVGDIITQVNHQPVKTTEDVSAIKNELQVGDSLIFTIWREGKTLEIEVLLVDMNDLYGGK